MLAVSLFFRDLTLFIFLSPLLTFQTLYYSSLERNRAQIERAPQAGRLRAV
jgi:hypothetical protein